MVVTVRPETGDSWLIGVHQCREKRGWSDEDKELFQAMAERLRDVIQVVNIRQALEPSERRLSFALGGADDAIGDWDIRGGFTYFSPRCTEWLGFERQPISTPSVPCYEKQRYLITTKDEGTGMELSISQTIIDAHNGLIWAVARKGGGTTFGFRLRISKKDENE